MNALRHSQKLKRNMQMRRSVRAFAQTEVPYQTIENCISIATSAPSGANMQPWSFVLVGDPKVKLKIRDAAEELEREFYERRASDEWKDALRPLKVNWEKPFLTDAPWLICVFVQNYGYDLDGNVVKHYYPRESTGIAVGFLLSALHQIGLRSLSYTPAPMGFLTELLNRPDNERPFMIIPVGYPDATYQPPVISRRPLNEMLFRL